MKQKCLLLAVFIAVSTICLAQPSFKARLVFEVTNDEGKPIRGVPITASTFDHVEPGELSGVQRFKIVTGQTDTNGLMPLECATRTGEFSYQIRNFPGHYDGGGVYKFKNVVNDRWQPSSPTVGVTLKPILNPVAMYARTQRNVSMPDLYHKYGYDLKMGDWVAPNGSGQMTDVYFELIGVWNANTNYDLTLVVTFPQKFDGIQPFVKTGGGFWSPREAPSEGYSPELRLRKARAPGQKMDEWVNDLGVGKEYFLRTRTKIDAYGKIQEAFYSKIYSGFFFRGSARNSFFVIGATYFNPEPNSRNMEFDPEKNLFKNMKPLEQVTAP